MTLLATELLPPWPALPPIVAPPIRSTSQISAALQLCTAPGCAPSGNQLVDTTTPLQHEKGLARPQRSPRILYPRFCRRSSDLSTHRHPPRYPGPLLPYRSRTAAVGYLSNTQPPTAAPSSPALA